MGIRVDNDETITDHLHTTNEPWHFVLGAMLSPQSPGMDL